MTNALFGFYGRLKARLGRGQQIIATVGWIWVVTSTFILFFELPKDYLLFLYPAIFLGIMIVGFAEDKTKLMSEELGYLWNRNPEWVKLKNKIDNIEKKVNE